MHGHMVADHEDMQMALHEHFSGIFGAAPGGGPTINFQVLQLHALNLDDLEAPIQGAEVWAAVKALPSDRAPGPDGFTGAFYKSAWPIIQQEVMEAIHAFSVGETRNLRRLNSSLTVLLPKRLEHLARRISGQSP